MTVIDKISFRFRMADEMFARNLYADWDGFCRHCVTDILEEFFAAYDDMETCLEIPTLELDLGSIPQERFLDVFPVRFREELEKKFLSYKEILRTDIPESVSAGNARTRRFENLLHYLEHGFCLPEWERPDFDLYEELRKYMDMGYGNRLFPLMEHPHVLARLFTRLDSAQLEKLFFSAADGAGTDSFLSMLFSHEFSLGRYERQRLLSMILETVPQSVVRFIHVSHDSGRLDFMAELLENPHVRSIMATETEDHAEIGVPEYWYRLYGWLLEYYPFNGVPMFGDKPHFRIHLNRSLLTFIHKRNSPVYLSKVDMTMQFLLEVFGADYYLTVLDIIYHNQRLDKDGSPESGDSYVWELYYIMLQLSLIRTEQDTAGHTGRPTSDEKADEVFLSVQVPEALARNDGAFDRWLENTELPDGMKRRTLSQLIQDKPELLIRWLTGRPDRKYLSLLAALTGQTALMRFAGHVSLQLAETLAVLSDTVEKASASVMWLRNAGKDRVTNALKMAVWQGISMGAYPDSDSASARMRKLSGLFYKEITGRELPSDDDVYAGILEAAGMSESGFTDITKDRSRMDNQAVKIITSLKTVLSDNSIPEQAKKIFVLQWFDIYRGKENELVSVLLSEKLSDTVFDLLDRTALRNLIMRLAGQVYSPDAGTDAIRFIGWLVQHIETVAVLVSRPVKDVWHSLFLSLASWDARTVPISVNDAVVRLLSAVTGNDSNNIKTVLESLISRLLRIPDTAVADNERTYHDSNTIRTLPDLEDNFLLSLLVRTWRYIRSEDRTSEWPASDVLYGNQTNTDTALHRIPEDDNPDGIALNETRTAFEQYVNDMTGLTGWLRDGTYTSALKSEVFRHYMNDSPKEAIRLLRETVTLDEGTVELWAEIISKDALLYLLGQSDSMLSERLFRTIGAINTVLPGNVLFTGGSEEWEQSVAKATLRMMTERVDMGIMNVEETVSLFLRHLHHILTGNREYTDADRGQWKTIERQAVRIITPETPLEGTENKSTSEQKAASLSFEVSGTGQDETLFDEWTTWLLSPSVSDTEKSQILRHYARWQPELLWKLVRYSTVSTPGRRHVASTQWSEWLGVEDWLEMISGMSLSLGDTLGRTVGTVSEKYGIENKILAEGLVRFVASYPIERIRYGNASDIVKKYLENVIALSWENGRPEYIRERSTGTGVENRSEQKEPEEEKQTESPLPAERKTALEAVVKIVEEELHLTDAEQALEESVLPEYIEVPNAGLCLLAVWFTRLFGMLGLLEEKEDGKKDLKDAEARIRAIFILQRIVTGEPREYKEQELAFNRILTGCPFYVPLPKTLTLTSQEIQTVESMLSGVKSNWDKLKNTSVKGFQHSFIERPGKLEQREDKWVLYVENRSYDILLDTLPWSYRQIRLPWLKKKINVIWRDKEEFDFENYNN